MSRMDLHFEWDEDKAAVAGKPLRRSEDNMNEEIDEPSVPDDELLPEYDFSGGVRGKHHAAFQRGYKIVGISKSTGGVYNKNGIDLDALLRYYRHKQTFKSFPDAEEVDSAELLLRECDILIPAASENQITSRNAEQLKARILCEGANGPTTAAADDILADKQVFVIPDILANSGGVTVSYFEWVQDRQGYFWAESVVNDQLEHIMRSSFAEVLRYGEAHNVGNRIAAYMLAIDRVAFTLRQRGIYA